MLAKLKVHLCKERACSRLKISFGAMASTSGSRKVVWPHGGLDSTKSQPRTTCLWILMCTCSRYVCLAPFITSTACSEASSKVTFTSSRMRTTHEPSTLQRQLGNHLTSSAQQRSLRLRHACLLSLPSFVSQERPALLSSLFLYLLSGCTARCQERQWKVQVALYASQSCYIRAHSHGSFGCTGDAIREARRPKFERGNLPACKKSLRSVATKPPNNFMSNGQNISTMQHEVNNLAGKVA